MISITLFEVHHSLECRGFAQAGVEYEVPEHMRKAIMDTVKQDYKPFSLGLKPVLSLLESHADWSKGYHLLGGIENVKIYMAVLKG